MAWLLGLVILAGRPAWANELFCPAGGVNHVFFPFPPPSSLSLVRGCLSNLPKCCITDGSEYACRFPEGCRAFEAAQELFVLVQCKPAHKLFGSSLAVAGRRREKEGSVFVNAAIFVAGTICVSSKVYVCKAANKIVGSWIAAASYVLIVERSMKGPYVSRQLFMSGFCEKYLKFFTRRGCH